METPEPLLSLCIPTNGRVDWVGPLLSSIYSQQVDNSLFEVVITDNARNPELEKAVAAGHTELWDLAEQFGVTEALMRKAVRWYETGRLSE